MARTTLIALFAASLTFTGGAGASCDPDHLADVSFIEGGWHVWSEEPARTPPRQRTGTATVRYVAGGCALEEILRFDDGHEEIRILAFDARGAAWQLSLVDSDHGNIVSMQGHTIDDGLEFISTHQRADRLLVDRVQIRSTPSGWLLRINTAPGYGTSWRLLQELNYSSIPVMGGDR